MPAYMRVPAALVRIVLGTDAAGDLVVECRATGNRTGHSTADSWWGGAGRFQRTMH